MDGTFLMFQLEQVPQFPHLFLSDRIRTTTSIMKKIKFFWNSFPNSIVVLRNKFASLPIPRSHFVSYYLPKCCFSTKKVPNFNKIVYNPYHMNFSIFYGTI